MQALKRQCCPRNAAKDLEAGAPLGPASAASENTRFSCRSTSCVGKALSAPGGGGSSKNPRTLTHPAARRQTSPSIPDSRCEVLNEAPRCRGAFVTTATFHHGLSRQGQKTPMLPASSGADDAVLLVLTMGFCEAKCDEIPSTARLFLRRFGSPQASTPSTATTCNMLRSVLLRLRPRKEPQQHAADAVAALGAPCRLTKS